MATVRNGDFTRTLRITSPSKRTAGGSRKIGTRSCVTTVKKHVPPGTYQRRYSDIGTSGKLLCLVSCNKIRHSVGCALLTHPSMKARRSSSGLSLFLRVNHQCRQVSQPSIRASAEGLAPMGASRRLKGTTPSTNEHQAQGWVESSPSARDAAVFPLSRGSCFRRRCAAGPQLAGRRVIGPPST